MVWFRCGKWSLSVSSFGLLLRSTGSRSPARASSGTAEPSTREHGMSGERAALAWTTEAVTRIADTHVPDAIYADARDHLSETEIVDLTYVVVAFNAWNRLAISFRTNRTEVG
jgi:alkylhydroperoxidase family enzyme